jgi:hypothetical protein
MTMYLEYKVEGGHHRCCWAFIVALVRVVWVELERKRVSLREEWRGEVLLLTGWHSLSTTTLLHQTQSSVLRSSTSCCATSHLDSGKT